MRAKNLAARQSGRSEVTLGRRMPPAKTSSSTPFSRRRRNPSAAAPSRMVACGAPVRMAGSASPAKASTKNGRSAARQASTRRRGRSPDPARIPSLPAIPVRLADAAARFGTKKGEDILNRLHPGEAVGNPVDPLAEGSSRSEEHLEGAAQLLDLLAREAAALHADDVEAGEPRPVAHHRAVGDDVALDAGHAADHCVLADADELMHGAEAAEDGIVADHDVTAER